MLVPDRPLQTHSDALRPRLSAPIAVNSAAILIASGRWRSLRACACRPGRARGRVPDQSRRVERAVTGVRGKREGGGSSSVVRRRAPAAANNPIRRRTHHERDNAPSRKFSEHLPTHLFGTGLKDDRYVVEKFRALVNGEICRAPEPAPAKGRSRRKTSFPTVTLKTVREMRPGPQRDHHLHRNAVQGRDPVLGFRVRRPLLRHLDAARREALGPWRIGSEDETGIHVLDANGERVATIWPAEPAEICGHKRLQVPG